MGWLAYTFATAVGATTAPAGCLLTREQAHTQKCACQVTWCETCEQPDGVALHCTNRSINVASSPPPSPTSPPPPAPNGLAWLERGLGQCVNNDRHWFRDEDDWDADSISQCAQMVRQNTGGLCEGTFFKFPRLDWSTNWGCMCCKPQGPGGPVWELVDSTNWRVFEIFEFTAEHAASAFIELRAHYAGGDQLSEAGLEHALAIARAAASFTFEPFVSLIDTFIAEQPQPSKASPVRPTDALAHLAAQMSATRTQELSASLITAHPAAADFPGLPDAGARLASAQTVTVDATYVGRDSSYLYSGAGAAVMRSTGLYAGAGELISVTIPDSATAAGLQLRIGCHTDSLGSKPSLERSVRVVRDFALTATTTAVANAFGGLVYLTVPGGTSLGRIEVTLSGGLYRALSFHHNSSDSGVGRTDSLEDWQEALTLTVAPWAEFVTSKIILTVPTSGARAVTDPVSLMGLWDRLMDAAADLEGTSRTRVRPERFVLDRQISNGWMHSGALAPSKSVALRDKARLSLHLSACPPPQGNRWPRLSPRLRLPPSPCPLPQGIR